jgi:lysosomal acid lipase/cholesteryl ester hydrolase
MKEKFLRARSLSLSSIRTFFVNKINFRQIDEFCSAVDNAGYRSECHSVKTVDGYKLKVHRVLPKSNSTYKGSTFLMHGLFRNSCDFLASGPQTALTYYLADNGFDVWLGNSRGTKFCQEHETLSPESREFWNFSFHEIGLHDVSSMLNFVLEQTKEPKMFYIGHSQGTSALLVLLSTSPDYNKKIAQAHLITPAVFMKHSTSPMLTSSLFKSKSWMVRQNH